MSLPVSVRFEDTAETEIRGVTRDVSSGGAFVFLKTNQLITGGKPAELIMELPAEVTLCEALHVRCCVRVLRVERAADGVTGIAVQITDFDFLAGA